MSDLSDLLQRLRLSGDGEATRSVYNELLESHALDSASPERDICLTIKRICSSEQDARLIDEVLISIESVSFICSDLIQSCFLGETLSLFVGNDKCNDILLSMIIKGMKNDDLSFSDKEEKTDLIHTLMIFSCNQIASANISLSESASTLIIDLVTRCTQVLRDDEDTRNKDFEVFTKSLIDILSIELQSNIDKGDVILIRFTDIICKMAYNDELAFIYMNEKDLISRAVLQKCKSTDILIAMSALDLLPSIATTKAGTEYLANQGCITWLLSLLEKNENGSSDPILEHAALNSLSRIFNNSISTNSFSSICTFGDNLGLVAAFIQSICSQIENADDVKKAAIVNSIVEFCTSSTEAMIAMLSNEDVLSLLFMLLVSAKTDIKGIVLHGLATILEFGEGPGSFHRSSSSGMKSLSLNTEDTNNEEIQDLKLKLFRRIGTIKQTSSLEYLFGTLENPFTEIKFGGIRILAALCMQKSGWGLNAIFNSSFNESLHAFLEKHTEHEKAGKEWKFSIIDAIHNNPQFGTLTEGVRNYIDRKFRQGPYYRPAEQSDVLVV
jgi:hypothetical protein